MIYRPLFPIQTAPVVPQPGHRANFNRIFSPGGAENGTLGEVGGGFRDRWGGKWDTGRGSTGISGQVGRKMGHRARFEGRFGGCFGELWAGGGSEAVPPRVDRRAAVRRRYRRGLTGGRRFGGMRRIWRWGKGILNIFIIFGNGRRAARLRICRSSERHRKALAAAGRRTRK